MGILAVASRALATGEVLEGVWILLFQQPSEFIHFPIMFLSTQLDLRAFCAQAWILRSDLDPSFSNSL